MGAVVGLLLAAALAPVIGILVTAAGLGVQPAILAVVGLVVFIIIALGGATPILFNNFTLPLTLEFNAFSLPYRM